MVHFHVCLSFFGRKALFLIENEKAGSSWQHEKREKEGIESFSTLEHFLNTLFLSLIYFSGHNSTPFYSCWASMFDSAAGGRWFFCTLNRILPRKREGKKGAHHGKEWKRYGKKDFDFSLASFFRKKKVRRSPFFHPRGDRPQRQLRSAASIPAVSLSFHPPNPSFIYLLGWWLAGWFVFI